MSEYVMFNNPGEVAPSVQLIDRVEWGAIWAGVVAALGMELLFSTFGLFIGFTLFNSQAANNLGGISTWSLVWYLVTAAWSMFFGAWCAARMSGDAGREMRLLHGIATWGLATLVTVAFTVLASWSALRVGLNMAGNSLPPATGASPMPTPQNAVGILSSIALRVWGGLLLGFVAALIGSLMGGPTRVAVRTQEDWRRAPRAA